MRYDRSISGSDANLAGRFDIRRRLGAGGMGVVYEAFDSERGGTVALKVMRGVDPSALYRFKREFRALSDMRHRNLVSLYELLSEGDEWFFTMELIDGESFRDYVRPRSGTDEPRDVTSGRAMATATLDTAVGSSAGGGAQVSSHVRGAPLDEGRLREALPQLAEGVFALHAARRVHRDIKPSNVLVTREGRVALCDFGLVQEITGGAADQTMQSGVVGTVAYMSPEQAAGAPVTEASDWYSVGVMLYEALAGRLPFTGEPRDVLLRKQATDAPPLSELVPDAPEDLARLCTALVARRPEDRPTGASVMHKLGVGPDTTASIYRTVNTQATPFVGRGAELAKLRSAFESSQQGTCTALFVRGRSGDGKSALVSQFCDLVHADANALVLTGRCYERESVPYKAFDTVIDSLSAHLMSMPSARVHEVVPTDIVALMRLFPVLRRVEALEGRLSLGFNAQDPLEVRRRAFGALRALLANIAAQRPIVVSIDDLQWGDDDSGRLLLELLRQPGAPPICVVATYRGEAVEHSPLLRSLPLEHDDRGDFGDVRAIALEPLAPEDAANLARAVLHSDDNADDDTDARADEIAREAAGNPFFVMELARYAAGEQHIGLDQLVTHRLGRLSAAPRNLLIATAVASRPVELGVIRDATGLDTGFRDALAELRVDHLVRTMGVRDTDRVETYHDRVRESVIASLDEDTLRSWHERLARAHEARTSDDHEVLLEHWRGAGAAGRAADHAVEAARQAAQALAFDRAVRLYRIALELGTFSRDKTRDLNTRLGDALVSAGRGREAADTYLAAVDGARAAERLELHRRAAEQLLRTGHFDRGLDAVATVLKSVGMKLAPTPRRALFSLLRRRLRLRLRGLKFKERDPSQLSAEDLTRIDILWSVATGMSEIDTIRGSDFQTRHLLECLRAGEPYRVARGLAMEAAYTATGGAPMQAQCEYLANTAREVAERINHPHALGLVEITTGIGHFLRGEWKDARDTCLKGERILRDNCTDVSWETASAQFFLLGATYYLGDLAALSRLVPERLREADERGDLYFATGLRSWRTNVAWLARDQPEEARRQVALAREQWSRKGFHLQHYYEMLANGQVAMYEGRGRAAWDYVHENWRALKRSLLMRVQNVRIEGLHLHARTALAAGLETGDASLYKIAAADAKGIVKQRRPWADGIAGLVFGAVHAHRGDGTRGIDALREAERLFDESDMAVHAAVARYRLARLENDASADARAQGALADLAARGAARPERIVALLAPGYASDD